MFLSRPGLAWAAVVVAMFVTPALAGPPLPPQTVALPIVVHVTQVEGQPIATGEQVQTLIDAVNQIYGGSVCFVMRETRVSKRSGDLATYRDRTWFRRLLVPKAINVVLVSSIIDPSTSESTKRALARVGRKASGFLAGAEIQAPKHKPSRFLIVRLLSGAETLAHELGHFLGEGHHKDPTNLMSYGNQRRGFDSKQLTAFPRRARSEIRQSNLSKVTCPSRP